MLDYEQVQECESFQISFGISSKPRLKYVALPNTSKGILILDLPNYVQTSYASFTITS